MTVKSLLGCALVLVLAGCAASPDPYVEASTAYVRHLAPTSTTTWRGVHYDALAARRAHRPPSSTTTSRTLRPRHPIPIEELGRA